MKYFLSSPIVEQKDLKIVKNILKKGILYPDIEIENKFSKSVGKYSGYKYNLPLSSGTAALHLALKTLEIKKNDFVIVCSMNFIGGVAPILYLNAKPIFVDIDDTFTISYNEIKKIITQTKISVKAVILTDLYGQPSKEEEIVKLCNSYNIKVISDSAESFGSNHHTKIKYNSIVKIFSFNSNKIITGGSGGCFSTNNIKLFNKAFKLSRHSKENFPYYHHSEIGYNYRLNSLASGLIISQINSLKKRLNSKKKLLKSYQKCLINNFKYNLPKFNFNKDNSNWLIVLEINNFSSYNNSNQLIKYLHSHKIEARHLWKPMHLQPVFKGKYKYFGSNYDKRKFKNCICLPSNISLKMRDIKYIINVINNF